MNGIFSSDLNANETTNLFSQSTPLKITPAYLKELLEEKKLLLAKGCGVLIHSERLLEKEIATVREKVCGIDGNLKKVTELPDPEGDIVTLTEKVFVPVKDNPEYNFVGRLLGPRGMTIKQLEQDLLCKIMVRGKGSIRNKEKEDENRGKPNWEHLNEDLHVLLSVEDHQNRAEVKITRAKSAIEAFLQQALLIPESEDILKQMQLADLAVLNEKERHQQQQQALLQQQQSLAAAANLSLSAAFGAQNASNALYRLPMGTVSSASLLSPASASFLNGTTSATNRLLTTSFANGANAGNPLLTTMDPTTLAILTASSPYLTGMGTTVSPYLYAATPGMMTTNAAYANLMSAAPSSGNSGSNTSSLTLMVPTTSPGGGGSTTSYAEALQQQQQLLAAAAASGQTFDYATATATAGGCLNSMYGRSTTSAVRHHPYQR